MEKNGMENIMNIFSQVKYLRVEYIQKEIKNKKKNIMMVKLYLKENIKMAKNGQEK